VVAAPPLFKRISWGAIFAGLIIALVTQLTLTLLGAAIGLASIDPQSGQAEAKTLAIGSAIWLVVSGLISMYVGGCVAGRLCGAATKSDGLLHGFVTWGTATLVAALLVTTAIGNLFGGAIGLVTKSFAMAGPQATGSAPMLSGVIKGSAPAEVQEAANLSAKDPELGAALARMFSHGGASAPQAERDAVAQALVSRHGMTQEQAVSTVERWNQQYAQVRTEAEQRGRELGHDAAQGGAKAALWGFIALILGAAVSSWGGWSGAASIFDRDVRRRDVREPA